ncbi:HEAT repeat domain-containing protein [Paractinoplanes lichenicola]|uniref:HEAT repeat domain-containing protein n=1 Tax=Paractinoplanes lichenicola TaxID=2802976 RepID=A0ABS1VW90_9ACTN|nr:HEAT repeat domain-containing protein [Actinoplanes lichenicola]MBL7258703.1 HEAT repeat domain-containing protein [Actinoplanes lichenicola]
MDGDAEWRQWRREMFGDPYVVWHEGPQFAALLEAARREPRRVERMLRAGLAAGDTVAAQSFTGLAAAGLAPADAVSILRTGLIRATDEFRIRVAEALHALTGDPGWATPIAEVLTEATSELVRLDAAIALASFPPNSSLIQTLATAVVDPEYLVRYHAANTLLRWSGDPRQVDGVPTLLEKITDRAEGAWRAAADELTARLCR